MIIDDLRQRRLYRAHVERTNTAFVPVGSGRAERRSDGPRSIEVSDHDARQVLIAAHAASEAARNRASPDRRARPDGVPARSDSRLTRISNTKFGVDRVRVVDVAAVVGAILKTARDRKTVDYAGPVLAIFGIEAVIVLAEDRLVRADAMIDARQPARDSSDVAVDSRRSCSACRRRLRRCSAADNT